jgi:polyhydroxyalkanoate synthase
MTVARTRQAEQRDNASSLSWPVFEFIDGVRRAQGSWLDALGLGRIETPCRIVFSRPGVSLKAYGRGAGGPVLLLVPAPIKRSYIWDLAPEISVVRRCLEGGAEVYLTHWEPLEADQNLGLDDFADRLILECVEAVERAVGPNRLVLVGHSLGGLLAAIFASLHPERLRGLGLLAAPIHFGPEIGAFGRFAAAISRAEPLPPVRVPGSFLNVASFHAAPTTFEADRLTDWLSSLPDPQALQTHIRVERWTLDEFPLPRRFFEEVAQWLVREDRFMQGTLVVRGARAAPKGIATPLLCVSDRRCELVPPGAVLPFLEAVATADKELLWYEGDTGVALQHVGMLVGDSAHRNLWPKILDWIHAHV